jgi:(p)ppGpp synthase/HD superfamily hydrolase
MAHLLGVAALVLEDGGSEDETIAALLHDAPEDRGGRERLDDIRVRFGDQVATIVDGCTDTHDTPKPPFLPRKQEHIRRLRRTDRSDILRVTAADKLNNARAVLVDFERLGEAVFERFTEKKPGTLWYYACMVNVLRDRFPGPLTRQLERVVTELREAAAPGLRWPKSEDEVPAQEAC